MSTPLAKAATEIAGFDEVTAGGLPIGRLTLLVGTAGTGKTVLALESLVRGALQHDEPGLFVAFEESPAQLRSNAASFSWYPRDDAGGRVGYVDARLPEALMQEGDFDLLGLLAQLDARADEIGARRVVFDGLDVLFDLLGDPRLARREVMRVRRWVDDRGMVGVITAKSVGGVSYRGSLDFLQFAVDCVAELRQAVIDRTAHRTLQVTKYRGSGHSSDEHPFAITPSGVLVSVPAPVRMEHAASTERVATGIAALDRLVGGGYWRGSCVLVSGAPGTAKTTLGGAFLEAACERGERGLFVSFDEASSQIVRNLRSVGVDLAPHVESGVLRMSSFRTRSSNVELHVDRIRNLVDEHAARCVVIDPLSAFQDVMERRAAEDAAMRLVDACKERGVTLLATSLVSGGEPLAEHTPIGLSTIADAWIHLAYVSRGGERNRTLSVVKVRGTGHSNQVRELLLSDEGIRLADVYTAGGEVLLGTLRWEKERQLERAGEERRREAERKRAAVERELSVIRTRAAALQAEQESLETELERIRVEREEVREEVRADRRAVRAVREPGLPGED